MEQFIEFAGNHLVLSGIWLALVGAIFFQYRSSAGKSVGPQQAVMLINRANAIVVDVRDKKEFEVGHVVGAINIPLAKMQQRLSELEKHKDKHIVLVCKMGQHSSEAYKTLNNAGFTNVVKLAGGVTEWKAQSLPLVQS